MSDTTLHQFVIPELQPLHRGKVRDIYAIDEEHLLIITSDRLSAFDVVLPQPIPGKGAVLTRVSNFWFAYTADLIPNHLTQRPLHEVLHDAEQCALLAERAVVVKRLQPLPIEAIVRGYLIGSGWKEYQQHGAVCGLPLPPGLPLAGRLPEPIFTPSTKAAVGEHDQNISFEQVEQLLGSELAAQVRSISLALYRRCAAYALERGIIIADTKFEFGRDAQGTLYLMDEVLTPDSSRFWPADQYQPGSSPPSFDKQYVRDYLEGMAWDKRPPAPQLPLEVILGTAERYHEAEQRLMAG